MFSKGCTFVKKEIVKTFASALGLIVSLLGFFALVLSLVGIKLSFLTFIDSNGPLLGFVIRLLMIVIGLVIVTLAQTDWKSERRGL